MHALFEKLERFFERQFSLFEFLHDVGETLHVLFERCGCGLGAGGFQIAHGLRLYKICRTVSGWKVLLLPPQHVRQGLACLLPKSPFKGGAVDGATPTATAGPGRSVNMNDYRAVHACIIRQMYDALFCRLLTG